MVSIKRDNLFLPPKRCSPPKSEGEFGRKTVKNWVDNLSIGNVNRLSHDLHGKLDRLNRLNIPPLDRFEILEQMQTPLHFVLDMLKQRSAGGDIPLGTKARLAADMRLEIMVQTVIGYKIVLSQFHADSITGFLLHRHARSEALGRALFYLGEILLHSYMVYQACPDYVWKELHAIYHYSATNEMSITTGVAGSKKSGSLDIEALYKQILLLAMANPHSLLRGEVEKVHAALAQWSSSAKLVPINKPVWAKSFFLIDVQSDAMPCTPNLCSKDKINVGWALVTDDLDRLLEEKIKAAESAHMRSNKIRPADTVSERLMNKLRAAWMQQIRSREVRTHTLGLVELICGLEPLYMLHGGECQSNTVEATKPFVTKPGYAEVGSFASDSDAGMIVVESGILESLGLSESVPEIRDMREITVDRKVCITTNKSEKGYCLNWPVNGTNGTRVGELVGVNPVSDKENGMDVSLGVIRWMHIERSDFLGMGVELLGGLVKPVILQRKRKGVPQPESMKGLLQRDGEGSMSLIIPPFYVDEWDLFSVAISGDRQPVELGQIIESTGSFVRFRFEQVAGTHF